MSDYRQTGRTTRQIQDLVDCAMGEPGRTVVWVDRSTSIRQSSYGEILGECGGRGVFAKAVKQDMRIFLVNGSAIQCVTIESGPRCALEGICHRLFIDHNAWRGLDAETQEWIVCRYRARIRGHEDE